MQRKTPLRVVLVAAAVTSVSLLGAGVAAADGYSSPSVLTHAATHTTKTDIDCVSDANHHQTSQLHEEMREFHDSVRQLDESVCQLDNTMSQTDETMQQMHEEMREFHESMRQMMQEMEKHRAARADGMSHNTP